MSSFSSAPSRIRVTTADGAEYEADKVIMTVSVGVLKEMVCFNLDVHDRVKIRTCKLCTGILEFTLLHLFLNQMLACFETAYSLNLAEKRNFLVRPVYSGNTENDIAMNSQ